MTQFLWLFSEFGMEANAVRWRLPFEQLWLGRPGRLENG